jgi:serine phosphatase RsbU (regulator of sigma subunit)
VISYSIAAGLIMVLIFAFFVFNRLQLTRKQKLLIEHQKRMVEEKQKEIVDSIIYAKRLQEAILPTEHLVKRHLPRSFIFYKPKDIVAGDFYWFEYKKGLIFIAAADCTGHGVPGALVSVVCSNALNRAVLEFGIIDPGKILDKSRELILETFSKSDKDVKDGMDISLVCINPETFHVKWAGANNPLWYIQNNTILDVSADKQPVGKGINERSFTTHDLQLQKDDMVFLFTDGFADQFGGNKGKKFKYRPLKDILFANAGLPLETQQKSLKSAFDNWKGSLEQVDDVCIIGLKL